MVQVPHAFAQTVTQQELDRARESQPVITRQQIDDAARRHRAPTDDELRRIPLPRVDVNALPAPSRQAPDLGAIAEGFRGKVNQSVQGSPLQLGPGLLVFVSFSLPQPTMQRLVDQTLRAGGTLVLRGFIDGSMQATAARVRELIGTRSVGFQIDPQLFDRFGVSAVPTFVVVNGGQLEGCKGSSCPKSEPFAAVAGDVSVDYALEYMVSRSAPMRASATKLLDRYRNGQSR